MTPRTTLIMEAVSSIGVMALSLGLYVARLFETRQPIAEENAYYALGFVVGAINGIRQSRQLRPRPHVSVVINRPATPPMTIQNNDVRVWVNSVSAPQIEGKRV